MYATEKIKDNYFDPRLFRHNFKSDIVVEMVKLNYYDNFAAYDSYILNNVIDYSYDCKVDSEVRQSASLTLYQPKEDTDWYFRRETLAYEGYNPKTQKYDGIMWNNYLYHLVKKYKFQDGTVEKFDLGYFTVTDSGYNYDSTTSTVTLTLAGLTARYQTEYGGAITTTKVGRYLTDKEIATKISAIQSKIRNEEISPATGQNEINKIQYELQKGHGKIEIEFPMSISINKDVSINQLMFEQYLVYEKKPFWFHKTMMEPPVAGMSIYDFDVWYTPKLYEFDNGTSAADIVKTLLDDCMQNGCYYIDENLILHMCRKAPTGYGFCNMLFKDYQMLVIDENTDASDSGFYNYIEVYGKDGSYYGNCDWSAYDGGQIRKTTMSFSELQSDDECKKRARWECYKARYGHETITITLADNYIPEFYCPSNLVGTIVEYRMMHGNTNTFVCTGLSYSNNRWTMNLQLFRPLYLDIKTDDIGEASEQQKLSMLSQPVFNEDLTELIDDHIVRVYVTGDDIEYSLVRIFDNGTLKGETVKQEVIDGVTYKVFDLPVTGNYMLHLRAQFYNPCRESSIMTDIYEYKVEGYKQPHEEVPEDPYPHPKMEIVTYNITTNDGQILTDTADREFTITERK